MKSVRMHRKYAIQTNFLDTMLEHQTDIQEGETKLDAYRRGLKELDQIATELRREQESMRGQIIHETLQGITPHDARGAQVIPVISKGKEPTADNLSAIQNCLTLEELKTYKTLASSDPTKVLYEAYCNRIKELSK